MWIGEFAAIWISSWELKHEVCSQFHNSALKTFTLFFLNIRLMLDLFLFSDQATTHPVTTGIIFSHKLTWSDSKQQTAEGSAEKIIKNHVVLFIYILAIVRKVSWNLSTDFSQSLFFTHAGLIWVDLFSNCYFFWCFFTVKARTLARILNASVWLRSSWSFTFFFFSKSH